MNMAAGAGMSHALAATQHTFYATGHNASSSGFVNMTTLANNTNTNYSQSESLIGSNVTGTVAPPQQYQQYITQQQQQQQQFLHQQQPQQLNGQNMPAHDLLF
ncbi:hypothetical protein D0Z03_001927 [Geotrichum reessii]|nr:hypothetical protein D0Z03_001927 [Galactomyces reessii]